MGSKFRVDMAVRTSRGRRIVSNEAAPDIRFEVKVERMLPNSIAKSTIMPNITRN